MGPLLAQQPSAICGKRLATSFVRDMPRATRFARTLLRAYFQFTVAYDSSVARVPRASWVQVPIDVAVPLLLLHQKVARLNSAWPVYELKRAAPLAPASYPNTSVDVAHSFRLHGAGSGRGATQRMDLAALIAGGGATRRSFACPSDPVLCPGGYSVARFTMRREPPAIVRTPTARNRKTLTLPRLARGVRLDHRAKRVRHDGGPTSTRRGGGRRSRRPSRVLHPLRCPEMSLGPYSVPHVGVANDVWREAYRLLTVPDGSRNPIRGCAIQCALGT
jgi:hypothetical protein